MYITNDPQVVNIVSRYVDRIFIDLETLGKADRQQGMNTVQSQHCVSDISQIKGILSKDVELLVRCNPMNEGLQKEIDAIVEHGADIIMLPYFNLASHVEDFVDMVGGRVKTCLLIERAEAVNNLDDILAVNGIDEYYVGLNDLHLECGMKFMFEPLANGMLDMICDKLRSTGKPFGFGGIARVGGGTLAAERVIREHYRLGSTRAIVSRSFCNTSIITDSTEIDRLFSTGINDIRALEGEISDNIDNVEYFLNNRKIVIEIIDSIIHG